jgi:hypothetical protein
MAKLNNRVHAHLQTIFYNKGLKFGPNKACTMAINTTNEHFSFLWKKIHIPFFKCQKGVSYQASTNKKMQNDNSNFFEDNVHHA